MINRAESIDKLSRVTLTGKGPALCNYFFPSDNRDGDHSDIDYISVSKGAADRAGNDFSNLVVALDEMLSLKPSKTLA